jgi:hypothetical protein
MPQVVAAFLNTFMCQVVVSASRPIDGHSESRSRTEAIVARCNVSRIAHLAGLCIIGLTLLTTMAYPIFCTREIVSVARRVL